MEWPLGKLSEETSVRGESQRQGAHGRMRSSARAHHRSARDGCHDTSQSAPHFLRNARKPAAPRVTSVMTAAPPSAVRSRATRKTQRMPERRRSIRAPQYTEQPFVELLLSPSGPRPQSRRISRLLPTIGKQANEHRKSRAGGNDRAMSGNERTLVSEELWQTPPTSSRSSPFRVRHFLRPEILVRWLSAQLRQASNE